VIIYHFPEIEKKVRSSHGDTTLYQTIWASEVKRPESVKAFRDFVRMTIEPGGTNRIHDHDNVEQIYIFLQGGGTMHVGDDKEEVKAGDAVFIPAKTEHGFFNTGNKTAVILLLGVYV